MLPNLELLIHKTSVSFHSSDLKAFKGAYGQSLEDCLTWEAALDKLPSYVRKHRSVPDWIRGSVRHSRELYQLNRRTCDEWADGFDKEFNSWQILEWRGESAKLDIFDHLVQFRASGIRSFYVLILRLR